MTTFVVDSKRRITLPAGRARPGESWEVVAPESDAGRMVLVRLEKPARKTGARLVRRGGHRVLTGAKFSAEEAGGQQHRADGPLTNVDPVPSRVWRAHYRRTGRASDADPGLMAIQSNLAETD